MTWVLSSFLKGVMAKPQKSRFEWGQHFLNSKVHREVTNKTGLGKNCSAPKTSAQN
uniref:Uncharacterized protein n=1 Tax=Anguilla anguilla TaxID=7936 RepID=A0A0E9SGN8_ANGAN